MILTELNYIFATFLSFSFPYIFLVIEIFIGLNLLYLHKKHRRWTNSFWIKHFEMFPDIFSQILLIIWQKKIFTLNSFLAMKLSHRRCSVKKGVLKNFAKLTGKHLSRVSFLIKLLGAPATLLKKRLWHRCFPVNFANFLRTSLLTEHLGWLLLTFQSESTLYSFRTSCARQAQYLKFKWTKTSWKYDHSNIVQTSFLCYVAGF